MTLALTLGLGVVTGGVASAASTQAGCFGAVGCAGQDPVAAGCTSGATLIDTATVNGVGQINLWENSICATAWAVLHVSNTSLQGGNWPELAEIFYEPPLGGPEQFQTVTWSLNTAVDAVTLMLPISGSIKACGGDTVGTTAPFDADPQAVGGLSFSNPSVTFSSGACTQWH